MPKKEILAICAVNFCGWVLILAATAYNQNQVGSQALNFPLDWHGADQSTVTTWAASGSQIMRGAAQNWPAYHLGVNTTDSFSNNLTGASLSPGGRSLSYLWWLTFFQLLGIALSVAAVEKKMLRIGVVGLLSVLTSSTFLFTNDVYSAPKTGLFALTHDQKLSTSALDRGSPLYPYFRGLVTLFVGLIVVDVCNVLTMLLLPVIDNRAGNSDLLATSAK